MSSAQYKNAMRVGDVEIISLLDKVIEIDLQAFFPAVSLDELDLYRDVYPECYAGSKFRTFSHGYVIRTPRMTVLCDTGLGPAAVPTLGGYPGRLMEEMEATGISPEDVEVVVFTHLHRDHVGWNVGEDGAPRFANARYLAPRVDWEFFAAPDQVDKQPHVSEQLLPLHSAGVLDLIEDGDSVTPELRITSTPGHTPGHMSLLLSSRGEELVLTGDLAHHPAQLQRTEWCAVVDIDPEVAVRTRREWFRRIQKRGLAAVVCHFPGSGFGRVVSIADGVRWLPITQSRI